MNPIRFSIIDYLNALPLNMAFKDGLFGERASLSFDFPSQCADNLAAGRADAGLISSIEYQRIPHLLAAPGVCIAARSEVRSVLLISKKPLADVRLIALDRFSRSSAALVRVLFRMDGLAMPRFTKMTPDLEPMLAVADAALIIGDAALKLPPHPHLRLDLALEWRKRTGLPFVFAFWSILEGPHALEAAEMVAKAKAYGLAQLPGRYDEIRLRWPFPEAEIRNYFTQNLHYELGAEELDSLDRFYCYAHEAGLIEAPQPIRFASL